MRHIKGVQMEILAMFNIMYMKHRCEPIGGDGATHYYCYAYARGFNLCFHKQPGSNHVLFLYNGGTVKHKEAYKTRRAKKAKVGQLTYKLILCRLN